MPILAHIPAGTVSGIWGQAFRVGPKGKLIALQLGDKVLPGEHILTSDNGIVRVTDPEGGLYLPRAAIPVPLDTVLADLNLPVPKDPPVAGVLVGGSSGALNDGFRVTRVVEALGPLSDTFSTTDRGSSAVTGVAATDGTGGIGGEQEPFPSANPGGVNDPGIPSPPAVTPPGGIIAGPPTNPGTNTPTTPGTTYSAINDRITTPEDTPVTVNVTANDITGGIPPTLTQINGQAIVVGTPVAIDQGTVTLQPDGQLTFTPSPNSHGTTSFSYATTDGTNTSQATVTVDVTPVNDAPIAIGPPPLTTPEDTPIAVSLGGTDPDGTVTSVTLTTLPSADQGVLYLPDGVTPVTVGAPITPEQATQLVFKPSPDFHGQVDISFVVTDNEGATSPPASGAITVTSDTTPLVSVSDATANESAGFMTFTVTLNQPSSGPVSVNYQTVPGTATSGADYTPVAGTLNFEPGQTSLTVTVPIQPDTSPEGSENFSLVLSQPQQTAIADGTGLGTIVDTASGTEPTVSLTGPALVNEGAGYAVYTVTLSAPSTTPVTVSYGTTDGTATAGSDYTATTGTVSFPPGATTQTIVVPILNDGTFEGPETFTLNLGAPTNATLGTGSVTTTVTDDGNGSGGTDDDRPTLHVNDVTVNETDGYAVFSVSLSNPSSQATTVNLQANPGTATSPADYNANALEVSLDGGVTWQSANTATLPAGSVSALVRVPVVNDGAAEGSESFTLSAQVMAGTTTNASATGNATIVDDANANWNLQPDRVSTPEDQSLNGNVLANDDLAAHPGMAVSTITVNGITTPVGTPVALPGVGNLNMAADGSYTFTPAPNFHGTLPTITYTATDGAVTGSATLDVVVTPVNDPPVANDDHPLKQLTEDNGQRTFVTGNVIAGGDGDVADSDVDGDVLRVNGVQAGTGIPPGGNPALLGPVVVDGIYGTLTINPDGSYVYHLDNSRQATQNLAEGEQQTEVFTYSITDGQGGSDAATLSININGLADTTAATPTETPVVVTGLNGEYYGYNDASGLAPRNHADDGSASFGGPNLNSIEDVQTIINGRNAAVGGSDQLVGTADSALSGAMDANFHVTTLRYGFDPGVDNDLGNNPAVAPGSAVTQGQLFDFLGGTRPGTDAATLVATPGVTQGTTAGIDSGLGRTTDGIVRATGSIFFERGNYDFRVTGDDGFSLRVGGQTLVEYDGNQYPITRTFSNVEVGDNIDGLQDFELLYWEQGQNARLHVEYRKHGETEWQTLSTTETPLFTHESAPAVFDHRVQDIVAGDQPGEYVLRTGVVLDGQAGNDTLTGSVARDVLQGGAGDDQLHGLAGADMLVGGLGNDMLIGGAGADILVGGPGNDSLEGGLGDDIYRIDTNDPSDLDMLIERADEGTDTLELGVDYTADVELRNIADGHIENVTVAGPTDIQITGTDTDNRLTGGLGNNTIDGGAGNDRIIGGQGNDRLTGGLGGDTFEWHLADQGSPGQGAVDVITDFNLGLPFNERGNDRAFGYSNIEGVQSTGDRLDLRDLLQGEHSTNVDVGNWATPDTGNLENYIDISSSNGSTTIRLSSHGEFANGVATDQTTDQVIQLDGVDIWAATGVAVGDETALLQRLLKNGTLAVD